MIVPGTPSLNLKLEKIELPPFESLFSIERYALNYFIQFLQKNDPKAKPGILVPNFMCHEVNNAFKEFGLDVISYPIELNFTINLDKLDKAYSTHQNKVSFVLVSHLYGKRIKNLDAIMAWAQSKKIYILEDAAHLPFIGCHEDIVSDAKFYSIRKIYGLPRGAIIVNSKKYNHFYKFKKNIFQHKIKNVTIFIWFLRDLLKRLMISSKITLSRKYSDLSLDPLSPVNMAPYLLYFLCKTISPYQATKKDGSIFIIILNL
jgi:hypothetical protein